MLTSIPHRVSLLLGLGIAGVLLCEGCGGERYRTVVDAAELGLSSLTLADDSRHQRRLQAGPCRNNCRSKCLQVGSSCV